MVSNSSRADSMLVISCLALDEARPNPDEFCVSLVIANEPNVFIRVYDGYLQLDPVYNPRKPETFHKDASFYLRRNSYFPGYITLESVRQPGLYVRATAGGKMKIDLFQDTYEFRNAASFTSLDHSSRRT